MSNRIQEWNDVCFRQLKSKDSEISHFLDYILICLFSHLFRSGEIVQLQVNSVFHQIVEDQESKHNKQQFYI